MTAEGVCQAIREALRCGQPRCSCARPGPNQLTHCPAHDDRHPSLSITPEGDKVLVHCFGGCTQDAVIAALRQRGLWPDRACDHTQRSARETVKSHVSARESAVKAPGLTLAELAEAKRLPPDFLRQLGCRDIRLGRERTPAVAIPYLAQDGTEIAVRFRLALDGEYRFRWQRGAKLNLYGLQRLRDIRRAGWVLLVEGESDCWTGWHYGLPVLGVPGKSAWRSEWAALLGGLVVYLWREPDADDLVERVARDLPDLRVIIPPDGLKDLSEAHVAGQDVPALVQALCHEARPVADLTRREDEKTLAALEREARPLLEADDPLALVATELRRLGYGGDLTPALLVYLCLTTRLLAMRPGAMPAHLLLVGPPSAGKSYTLQTVLRLFPREASHTIDAGSPRVLIYDSADLRHRALIFSEVDSLPSGEDNPAASAVRNLLQDHRLRYHVVVRDPETGRYTPLEVDKPGPTLLVTTAVRPLKGQLGSRLFTLAVPEDVAQIRAALEAQADLELTGGSQPDPALIAFQAYLQRLAPWQVRVDFVHALSGAVGRSANATRILRDFQRLLSLIKAVAILRHRKRAKRDGHLVATIEDYAEVYRLVGPMYEATLSGVTPALRRVVEAVQELRAYGERATYTAVAQRVDLHPEQVKRLACQAVESGWLINHETRKNHPADLDVGEPLPETTGLPTPEALASLVSSTVVHGVSQGSVGDFTRSQGHRWVHSHSEHGEGGQQLTCVDCGAPLPPGAKYRCKACVERARAKLRQRHAGG